MGGNRNLVSGEKRSMEWGVASVQKVGGGIGGGGIRVGWTCHLYFGTDGKKGGVWNVICAKGGS